MKQRSAWVALGLLSVVAGGTRAQDASAPAPTPAAPTFHLAYKFRPGAVYRYHCSANGTINVDLSSLTRGGDASQSGVLSVDVTAEYDLIERVRQVISDGSARLALSIDNLTAAARSSGHMVAS